MQIPCHIVCLSITYDSGQLIYSNLQKSLCILGCTYLNSVFNFRKYLFHAGHHQYFVINVPPED